MKSTLLGGVAAIVLATAPTHAGHHEIQPFSGDIDAFWGDLSPFWGDISPFYGDISPFWGDISPFWGDISPFSGDISAFQGDLSPFWGDISPFQGDLAPFWGDLQPFWGDIGPFWGDLNAFWANADNDGISGSYNIVAADLTKMFHDAEAVFGARVVAETGQSFETFVRSFEAKYNIDIDSAGSSYVVDDTGLKSWTSQDRTLFFIDFYDSLMNFSGADRVDHWMATANWRPVHTQDLSMGVESNIGILDASIGSSAEGDDSIFSWLMGDFSSFTGSSNAEVGGHGKAVASLLVAPHDGRGVMGFAPHANVYHYNPFDSSGSADWSDVYAGVAHLAAQGSHVINMSLGKPGRILDTAWGPLFDSSIIANHLSGEIVFVKAAGNDGVTQTSSAYFSSGALEALDHLIIVGSVNPDKEISSFSNTPGDACVKVGFSCREELKNRFMVAPGEMILVEDGEGGTRRVSGTSFAAPMVAGTVALIHGRWPWFENHASQTVKILFETAEDLGEPGVDEVYGHGLLDVDAALSPISFDDLVVYEVWGNGTPGSTYGYQREISSTQLRNLVLDPGSMSIAESWADYLYAFEDIDGVQRDFAIPLSSRLFGHNVTFNGYNERAQSYITDRLVDWANGNAFSDVIDYGGQVAYNGRYSLAMTASRFDPYEQVRDGELGFQVGVTVRDVERGLEFKAGHGEGAMALTGQQGFGFFSDHRPETGGVNPILGLASGDVYAMTGMDLGERTKATVGFSTSREEPLFDNPDQPQLPGHESSAVVLGVTQEITPFFTANASYTHLDEADGALGARGSGALALNDGAQSDAFTVGAEMQLPRQRLLSFSATTAQTDDGDAQSALSLADGGVTSTAYQLSARQNVVFRKNDAMRLSLIQPLYAESGALEFTSLQVTDRETGETGAVTERWELGGQRPLVGEVLYATPVMKNVAQLNTFLRADLIGATGAGGEASAEAGFRVDFKF